MGYTIVMKHKQYAGFLVKVAPVLVAALVFLGVVFAQQTVFASASTEEACRALPNSQWVGGQCVTRGPTINNVIATFVNIFTVIISITAVFMIVYGGFRYITSGGDASKTAAARNTIMYAVIGLVIVALAQAIVRFVLSEV